MDIKQRIQELSLDQKAKLYYMMLLKKGVIDTLPEDPKAAYIRDMMDKENPKMDPAIRSDFDDPMFENLKETATELGYLNEDKQETIVSIDIPSGLNPDNGVSYSDTINADYTIMCLTQKQCCYTCYVIKYCG